MFKTDVVILTLTAILQLFLITNGTTDMENLLETEIEFRKPKSFTNYTFQTMSVRQLGFVKVDYNYSGILNSSMSNWEPLAFRYVFFIIYYYNKNN
jgi:hypothetical protein